MKINYAKKFILAALLILLVPVLLSIALVSTDGQAQAATTAD